MKNLRDALSLCLNNILVTILEKKYILHYKGSQKVISAQSINFKTIDDALATEYIQVPDYFTSFYQQADPILKKYDYTSIEGLIKKKYPYLNGIISNRHGGSGYDIKKWISKITYTILKSPPKIEDLSTSIDTNIEQFIQIISKRTYQMLVYLPILNLSFSSTIPQVRYTDDIFLKKLNYDELTNLFQNPYGQPDFSELSRSALVVKYTDDINFGSDKKSNRADPWIKINQEIENIIYALNLTESGAFFVYSTIRRIQGYFSNFMGDSTHKSFREKVSFRVNFSDKQLNKSQYFFNKLQNLKTNPFELALRKLNEAEMRRSEQDSIIDAVIGMESLLLNQIGNEKTRGELKYRFSTNYAILFPPSERLCKYIEAKETYDIRSLLVHGGKVKSNSTKYLGNMMNFRDIKIVVINQLRQLITILIDIYDTDPFDTQDYWLNKIFN